MRRRAMLAAVMATGVFGGTVRAAPQTPAAFVRGQFDAWYRPQAQAFVQASVRLSQVLRAECEGGDVVASRRAWREALLAWVSLSGVPVGPLVDRRSARRIDFATTRAESIARAIAQRPSGEEAMAAVGSGAKGFGALEALLWPDAPTDAAACAYAAEVADDIAREAEGLAGDFEAAANDEPDDAQALASLNEALSQWVGGLEQLRLQGLERPLHDPRGDGQLRFPRAASGAASDERQARWQALRTLAVRAPGSDGSGVFETLLRRQGLAALADRLVASTRAADRALAAARKDQAPQTKAAARALAALGTLVQGRIAPALDIRIGFTDADGD